MNWALLPKASKAVFPVIAAHCDADGDSFPGEEIIAALSGRTPKTVRTGIRELNIPGFNWKYYSARRGSRSKHFLVVFPPKNEKGRSFFFYRGIIDAGCWAMLTPSAQAAYPVFRYFARYDADEDETLNNSADFPDCFAARHFEICNVDHEQIAQYAGLDRHTVPFAIRDLIRNALLDKLNDQRNAYRVYLIPRATCLNREPHERQENT